MRTILRFLFGLMLTAGISGLIIYCAAYYAFVVLNDDFPYSIAITALMLSAVTLTLGVIFSWKWAVKK